MFAIFGNIGAPPGAAAYGTDVFTGLLPFLNNIIRLIFVLAGLFAFFNLIMGGMGFISAGGDPKAIQKAWGKIYQSLIGLIIIVSTFVLSAIFGYILFGNAMSILNPKIYGPSDTSPQAVTNQKNYLECIRDRGNTNPACSPLQNLVFPLGYTVPTACSNCLRSLSGSSSPAVLEECQRACF